MKKFISSILIAVLLFAVAGPGLVYTILINFIKEIKKAAILFVPESQITVLKLNYSGEENRDVWFFPNEFEICFNGKMYDIIKSEETGNITNIYCVHDEDEEKLTDNFGKTERERPHQNSSGSDFLSLLKILFNENENLPDRFSSYNKNKLPVTEVENFKLSAINEVLTPPPQLPVINS